MSLPDRMILRSTLTSPFGRKARMAVKVLGLEDRIEIVPADTLDETDTLRRQNPLGKMPTLLLPDGSALYDSRVIIEYLDTMSGAHRLLPVSGTARFIALARATLMDGIADAALLMVYEHRFREPEKVSERWLSHQRGKVLRALAAVVADLPDPGETSLVTISLACALGYLDWRKPVEWRGDHPTVVDWLERFRAAEPAFDATAAPKA